MQDYTRELVGGEFCPSVDFFDFEQAIDNVDRKIVYAKFLGRYSEAD